jgi:hypothetical protein
VTPERTSLLFRVDAAANLAIGLAALALLAAPELLGLPRWALVAVAVLALVNAADLARTGREASPAPAAVLRAAAVDVGFGVALLAVAVVGLDGQDATARWILAALGDVSLLVAALKVAGLRSLRRLQPA